MEGNEISKMKYSLLSISSKFQIFIPSKIERNWKLGSCLIMALPLNRQFGSHLKIKVKFDVTCP